MLIYDQRPSKDVGIFPNGDMILDENHDAAVTDRTLKISTSDSEKKKEQKPLNQGSTLLLFLLAALLFCACLTASTLAFVSSFRNERTSERKTKMFSSI
jgi:hypothetical protein